MGIKEKKSHLTSIEDIVCELYNYKCGSIIGVKMNGKRLFPVNLNVVQVSLVA